MSVMPSLPKHYRAIVIGSTGGLGSAFLDILRRDPDCGNAIGLSRASIPALELTDETSIAAAAESIDGEVHLIIDATGFLSDGTIMPEKALRNIEAENLARLYELNAIGPMLLMKHFAALLPRSERGIFATLSARVGSIRDNRLGGWHAYRASKAALNMLMKGAAIEVARSRPQSVFASLHPGTVSTRLSDPFSSGRERLSPEQSASSLLRVLDGLKQEESGTFWDYRGEPVDW